MKSAATWRRAKDGPARKPHHFLICIILALGLAFALAANSAWAANYINVVGDDSFAPQGYEWHFNFTGVEVESGWTHVDEIGDYTGDFFCSDADATARPGEDAYVCFFDESTPQSARPTLRLTGGTFQDVAIDALVTISAFEYWAGPAEGCLGDNFFFDDDNGGYGSDMYTDKGWIAFNPHYTSDLTINATPGTRNPDSITNVNLFSLFMSYYQTEVTFVRAGTDEPVRVIGHATCNDLDQMQRFSTDSGAIRKVEIAEKSQEPFPGIDYDDYHYRELGYENWIEIARGGQTAVGTGNIGAAATDPEYQRGLVGTYFDTGTGGATPVRWNFYAPYGDTKPAEYLHDGDGCLLSADGNVYAMNPATFFAMTPEYVANPSPKDDLGMMLHKEVVAECPVDTGDTVSWEITASLPVAGVDVRSDYAFTQLDVVDHLSEHLTYVTDSGRIWMDGEELPSWAGKFVCEQDPQTREWTLTYSFDEEYLKTLRPLGQYVEISFDTVAGEYPDGWGETRLPIPNSFDVIVNGITVPGDTAYAEMISPHKTINGGTDLVQNVGIGDTVTYAIEQEVHDRDVDRLTKYRTFTFTDPLPEYVEYEDGSYKVYDSEGQLVPEGAGTFSYDRESNTVTYDFSKDYLRNGMIYNGHAYKLEFETTVVDQPDDDLATVDNFGYVQANDLVEQTNVVSYEPVSPVLIIEKHADLEYSLATAINEYEYLSHDQNPDDFSTVHYVGTFQNTADKTRAHDVTMTDDLPAGLALVPGSVKATGADGIQITEDTEGSRVVIEVDGLDPWTTIAFEYDCYTTDEGNGLEVVNTADVWASNVDLGLSGAEDSHARDDGEVYVNDPTVVVHKTVSESAVQNDDYQEYALEDGAVQQREEYRVGDEVTYTVTMANTTPGTFAKNVMLTDDDMPSGMELVGNVSVTGLDDGGTHKRIFYPIAGETDSIHGEGETRYLDYQFRMVEDEDAGTWGWELNLNYLAYDCPVTVSWTVRPTDEVNGWEIYNQARATAENQPNDVFVSETPCVWVNTPEFDLDKHVSKTDKAYRVGDVAAYDMELFDLKTPGTLARQTTLEDVFQTEGTTIVENSFVIADVAENASDIRDKVDLNRAVGDQHWLVEMDQVYGDGGYWVCADDYRYVWSDGALTQVDGEHNPVKVDAHDYFKVHYEATINDMALQNDLVVNDATADSLEGFPVTDTEQVTVIGGQLMIDKGSNDGGHFDAGDVAEYELTIVNNATGTVAEDVQITDGFTTAKAGAAAIVDGSVRLYDNQNNAIEGWTVEYTNNESGNHIGFAINTNYDLPSYQKITVRYDVKYLTNNGSSVLTNTAYTWAANAPKVSDTYETWPSDVDQSDLIIDKGSDKQSYRADETAAYTLHVTNQNEGTPARNVVIHDEITLDTLGIAQVVKGSVKLWDEQGNGVSAHVTYHQAAGGQISGFTIETGKDLSSDEWLDVSYQVAFDATAAQSTQIHNECWAAADNTGKATDEHDVVVDGSSAPPDPATPEDPDEPDEPDPTSPEDPSDPGEPSEPDSPATPEDPVEPDDPSDPDEPSEPGEPTEPNAPNDPNVPEDPENPANPDDPNDPAAIDPSPMLLITKSVDKQTVSPGENLTWIISIAQSQEGQTARNVHLVDNLPASYLLETENVTVIDRDGNPVEREISLSDGALDIPIGDLAFEEEASIILEGRLSEDFADETMTNEALATADNADDVRAEASTSVKHNVPQEPSQNANGPSASPDNPLKGLDQTGDAILSWLTSNWFLLPLALIAGITAYWGLPRLARRSEDDE